MHRPDQQKPIPGRLRVAYVLYQVMAHLLLPVLLLLLLLRARKEPLLRKNLKQRFGFLSPAARGAVFVYAASLGETRAATPLLRLLLQRGEQIILTHASAAGFAEGARAFPQEIASGQIVQGFVPADLFWAVRHFYKRHRPKLGIIVEAELWPALLIEAARLGIPMVQINGNYISHSFQRDRERFGGVRLLLWPLYDLITTKSDERAARYVQAGVAPDRVAQVGELKFDLGVAAHLVSAANDLKPRLAPARPILTIASSVQDEEADLLEIVATLHARLPTPPLIVWVPRSPQRFAAVAELLNQAGYKTYCRSQSLTPELTVPGNSGDLDGIDILVGDSIGEMDFYYALADIVFVGATLADHGGHNIIEPLALQRPVVTGPSLWGIRFPANEAIESGALRAYDGPQALATALVELSGDPAALAAFRANTRGFNLTHRGAAKRTLVALDPFLG